MTDWVASLASPRLIELAIGLVVAEAVALGAYHAATGRGVSVADAAPNLAAGALLMAACRAALLGEPVEVTACLAASLAAHAVDLRRRWRR